MDNQEPLDTDVKQESQHPSWMVGVLAFAAGFAFALILCSLEGKVDISITTQNVYPSHQAE